MNSNIETGKSLFDKGNYKKALGYFQSIGKDDVDYAYAQVYQIYCLVQLKEYKRALKLINPMIEKDPYRELLWFNKVVCHISLNEDKQALKGLGELERIVDSDDKNSLLHVAKLYNLLNEFDKALLYCNKALDIDNNFKDALHEKSLVAIGRNDDKMINEIADCLLAISDGDIYNYLPAFLLKMFSKNYKGAYNIVVSCSRDGVSDDITILLKSVIYDKICDDLKVNILTNAMIELSIDDALKIMFDFMESGINSGNVGEVRYFVV